MIKIPLFILAALFISFEAGALEPSQERNFVNGFYGEGHLKYEANKASLKFAHEDCEANDAEACYRLGEMYTDGIGSMPDCIKAKKSFGKACRLHYRDGCKKYDILNVKKH